MENQIDLSRHRRSIYNIIRHLSNLPKITILTIDDNCIIRIINDHRHVPDIVMRYCDYMKHYRCYFSMAQNPGIPKEDAKYSSFTIGSGLVAAGFVGIYHFLVKNRSNNKGANNGSDLAAV